MTKKNGKRSGGLVVNRNLLFEHTSNFNAEFRVQY